MGIEEVHHKTPDLSVKEKFLAKKEKLLHGKDVDDAKLHEVKLRAQKLEDIREKLHAASRAMHKWQKSGDKMAKASGKLARDMPVNKGDYAGLSTDMKEDLLEDSGEDAIKLKLRVIDDMLKDASVLDDLLYLKHRRERKTDAADHDASRARRSALASCADNEYETLYEELMSALRSVVDSSEKDGLAALIAPELNAFKKLQGEYFADAKQHVDHSAKQETGTAEQVFHQHPDGQGKPSEDAAFKMEDLQKRLAEAEGKAAAADAQNTHTSEHMAGHNNNSSGAAGTTAGTLDNSSGFGATNAGLHSGTNTGLASGGTDNAGLNAGVGNTGYGATNTGLASGATGTGTANSSGTNNTTGFF